MHLLDFLVGTHLVLERPGPQRHRDAKLTDVRANRGVRAWTGFAFLTKALAGESGTVVLVVSRNTVGLILWKASPFQTILRPEARFLICEQQVRPPFEFQLTELQLKFNPRASDIESTIPAAVARDVLVERSMPVPIAGISVPFSTIPRLGLYGVGAAMTGLLAMLAATMVV